VRPTLADRIGHILDATDKIKHDLPPLETFIRTIAEEQKP